MNPGSAHREVSGENEVDRPSLAFQSYLHYHRSQLQIGRYTQELQQSWQQQEVQPLHPVRKEGQQEVNTNLSLRGSTSPFCLTWAQRTANTFTGKCDARNVHSTRQRKTSYQLPMMVSSLKQNTYAKDRQIT